MGYFDQLTNPIQNFGQQVGDEYKKRTPAGGIVTPILRQFSPAGMLGLYGSNSSGDSFSPEDASGRRKEAYEYGAQLGQKEFYDDPDMQSMRKTREDLSKGYDSGELGALRGEAKANVQGQRSAYMSQLQNNLAKSGVGGARGAAMINEGNQKAAVQGAEAERKVTLDSAQMKRQGVNDLQDFLMRQKLGKLGLAYGQQSLASADYAAEKGVQAAQSGGKK